MRRTIFVALCAVALFVMAPFALAESASTTWTVKVVPSEVVPPPNPVTTVYQTMTEGMPHDEFLTLATEHGLGKPCDKRLYTNDEGNYVVYKDWGWTEKDTNGAEWHTYVSVIIEDNKVRPIAYLAWKESAALRAR